MKLVVHRYIRTLSNIITHHIRSHCGKSPRIQSFSSLYFPVFELSTEKYWKIRTRKLRIQTFFTLVSSASSSPPDYLVSNSTQFQWFWPIIFRYQPSLHFSKTNFFMKFKKQKKQVVLCSHVSENNVSGNVNILLEKPKHCEINSSFNSYQVKVAHYWCFPKSF